MLNDLAMFALLLIPIGAFLLIALIPPFLQERRQKPTHICPSCLSLFQQSDGEMAICPYCDSEYCTLSYPEPLPTFLADRSLAELEQCLLRAQARIEAAKSAGKRNVIWYAKHDLHNVKRVIQIKQKFSNL